MRKNNVLTRDDIAIDHDMQIDSDEGREIIAYVETWFDVDRKFHIDTASDNDTSKGYRNPKQAAGGDVCERRQWRKKRAKRRGSGRNFVSVCEQKISGTATGTVFAPRARIPIRAVAHHTYYFFTITSYFL